MLLLVCALALALGGRSSLARSLEDKNSTDVVHLVFSNHLDIGYDGIRPEAGLDSLVLNKYFDWYFPLAINLAEWLEARGGPERHIYTAHAYVVSLYLDCPQGMGLHCPATDAADRFRRAARRGWITWTALPHNAQVEMMDPELLQGALQMTWAVDDGCGVERKTVMSQRDVPGLTRAALPTLAASGVRAISVGVNSGSAPPDVPQNTPFVWRDDPTGAAVIAFWHPFGYGGHTVGEYGKIWQVTPPEDCVRTPPRADGGRDILCFSWRGDNAGPFQDPDEVLRLFEQVRARFPGADVRASTLEDFVDALAPHAAGLPVVTGEVGDTWIQGVASDPVKASRFRAVMRMRTACLWSESCTPEDPAFANFTRLLLKVPEHTWGIDSKQFPGAWDVWTNADLRSALQAGDPRFAMAELSWTRQADYVQWAIHALRASNHLGGVADEMEGKLRELESPPAILLAADEGRLAASAACRPPLSRQATAPPRAAEGAGSGETPAHALRRLAAGRDGGAGVHRGADGGGGCLGGGPAVLETDTWRIEVDPSDGRITSFRRKWRAGEPGGAGELGTDWAADGTFARLLYSTYSQRRFRAWDGRYNPGGTAAFDAGWMYDFGKPHADEHGAADREASPTFVSMSRGSGPSDGEQILLLRYKFSGWPVAVAGAPPEVALVLHTWSRSPAVMLDVIYRDKAPTRLPEAMWVSFSPSASAANHSSVMLNKMGSLVSPFDVVKNGSVSLHALMDGGVTLTGAGPAAWEALQVSALDAPLAAVGAPDALPVLEGPPDVDAGFSYCLFNNVWGTNYVMWTPYAGNVGRNVKSRFVITVRDTRLGDRVHGHLWRDPHFSDVASGYLI